MRKKRSNKGGVIRFIREAWTQIWRTLVAGLLVWIPLIITISVSWFFVNRFLLGMERQVRELIFLAQRWGGRIPALSFLEHIEYVDGIGILLATALFFATGLLTRHLIGQRLIALGEKFVQVIPLVNRIYRAVQQIRDVFIGRKGAVFQQVCIVHYPREGMLTVAFITSTEHGLVQDVAGQELTAVFVPTTPNPTSGYLVYLPPEEVMPVDISVEEAMKLIVSAGAYIPKDMRAPNQTSSEANHSSQAFGT